MNFYKLLYCVIFIITLHLGLLATTSFSPIPRNDTACFEEIDFEPSQAFINEIYFWFLGQQNGVTYQFLRALAHRDYTKTKEFLQKHSYLSNIVSQQTFYQTPLCLAAKYNYPEMIELLIQYNANINWSPYLGDSALRAATRAAHLPCIKKLISLGADIHGKDARNQTATSIATIKKNNICIQLQKLLDREEERVFITITTLEKIRRLHDFGKKYTEILLFFEHLANREKEKIHSPILQNILSPRTKICLNFPKTEAM